MCECVCECVYKQCALKRFPMPYTGIELKHFQNATRTYVPHTCRADFYMYMYIGQLLTYMHMCIQYSDKFS